MSMEMNKALDLLREIRPSIPKEVLELWCKDRDAFLASHPAVEQAGANVGHGHVFPRADGVKMRCGGPGLCSECAADAYRARAALAQPSPKCVKCGGTGEADSGGVHPWGEPVNIGAMDAEDIDGDNVDLRFEDAEGRDTGCDVSIVEYAEKAADLFEQHDRIVGELRADRDSWAEQAEQRLADWDEMRKERDAALARVAELERKLRNEENAHTTTIEQRDNAEHWADQLANAIAERFGVDIGEHSNLNCPWNEALVWMQQPPAQAQHSVPEGWMLVECGIWTQEQVDEMQKTVARFRNSEFVDDRALAMAVADAGQCKAPEISLAELLAAAPGKEVGHE